MNGVLPICMSLTRTKKIKKVIVPKDNADEAALVSDIDIIPCESLIKAARFLDGKEEIKPHIIDIRSLFMADPFYDVDFSDVKGQGHAKRALEVAAAGGHNILSVESPGQGTLPTTTSEAFVWLIQVE